MQKNQDSQRRQGHAIIFREKTDDGEKQDIPGCIHRYPFGR